MSLIKLPPTDLGIRIKQLKLRKFRFQINSAASERKKSEANGSGFHFYDELVLPADVTQTHALAVNVIKAVRSMAARYLGYKYQTYSDLPAPEVVEIEDAMRNSDRVAFNSPGGYHWDKYMAIVIEYVMIGESQDALTGEIVPFRFKYSKTTTTRTVATVTAQIEKLELTDAEHWRLGNIKLSNTEDDRATQRAWWSFLMLTALLIPKSAMSELTVQLHVGAKLRDAFDLEGCQVFSDKYIPQLQEYQMAPGRRPPKGDFETMPSWTDKEAWEDWPSSGGAHAPIFLAGEAKQMSTGKASETGHNYRAQLQACIYPMLVQLLLVHCEKNGPKTALPEHFVIYGIYYDETRIEIHAHFPYWKVDGKEFNEGDPDDKADVDQYQGWRFAQVLIKSFDLPKTEIWEEGAVAENRARIDLAIALMAVRCHAKYLVTKFRDPDFYNSWMELANLQGTDLSHFMQMEKDPKRPRNASKLRLSRELVKD